MDKRKSILSTKDKLSLTQELTGQNVNSYKPDPTLSGQKFIDEVIIKLV